MKLVDRNTTLWNDVITFFHKVWGTLNDDGTYPPTFPGPMPVSIERKHLYRLKAEKYLVCEKSDGVRYALVCMKNQADDRITCLINRALDVHLITNKFANTAYKGTIMDGELVDNKFLIYDAVMVAGEDVSMFDLMFRLERCAMHISKLRKVKSDMISISKKEFYATSDIKEYSNEYMKTLTHKSDGFIFTPVDTPVKKGTHNTLYKWKLRDHNTVDFQLKRRHNGWGLYIQDRGKLYFESIIEDGWVDDSWMKEDMIVECQYMIDDPSPWWKPLNVRSDKTYPNNRITFYRTVNNVRENITLQELYDLLSH